MMVKRLHKALFPKGGGHGGILRFPRFNGDPSSGPVPYSPLHVAILRVNGFHTTNPVFLWIIFLPYNLLTIDHISEQTLHG